MNLSFQVLIEDLNKDVGLPPLNDDKLLESLFKKFDSNNNNKLEFSEFLNLYAAILRRVRDRYIKAQISHDASALCCSSKAQINPMVHLVADVVSNPVVMRSTAQGPNFNVLSVVVTQHGQQKTPHWVVTSWISM